MSTKNNDPQAAQKLAERFHEGQFRRDGVTPYIEHPRRVVEILEKTAGHYRTEDWQWLYDRIMCVAWMHDLFEDTECSERDMTDAGMSDSVIHDVRTLSKRKGDSYPAFISRLAGLGVAVKAVKLADMLANLGDAPTPKQVAKYHHGILQLAFQT